MLFGQVPKSQWQDWMSADRRNRVKLSLNCLLVRVGQRNFLIDTGVGPKRSKEERDQFGLSTSQLLSDLRSHGLNPGDVHGVVLTSLHFEHTGGCTRVNRRGEHIPTFPNATYYAQREALEEATSPTDRHVNGYVPNDYMPLYESGRLQLVDGEETIVPGAAGAARQRALPGPSDRRHHARRRAHRLPGRPRSDPLPPPPGVHRRQRLAPGGNAANEERRAGRGRAGRLAPRLLA